MGYCKYCGSKEIECRFGSTYEDRLGCDNKKCLALKVWNKNLAPSKDGYPKSKEDYLPPPKQLYNERTGEKIWEQFVNSAEAMK